MKKRIAIILVCVFSVSLFTAAGASAEGRVEKKSSSSVSYDSTGFDDIEGDTSHCCESEPESYPWINDPYDTGHCCISDTVPESYPEQGATDPTESYTEEPTESAPQRPSWIDDPYDTNHCCIDGSIPTDPYDIEGDTNHCEDPYYQGQHYYSDNEDETCFCGERHPLTIATETESATSRPSWMDDPYDTSHCCIDDSIPTNPYETEGDTSHCVVDYPPQEHHYSDIENETCFCGEHHPLNDKPTEPATTVPAETNIVPTEPFTSPSETAAETALAPIDILKQSVGNENADVDLFKKITDVYYLVHINAEKSTTAIKTSCIDKYLYYASDGGKEVFIFDLTEKTLIPLDKAYETGVINKSTLKTISKTIHGKKNLASLDEHTYTLKAGEKNNDYYFAGKNVKFSKQGVAKLVKDKFGLTSVVGLKKGSTTLSYTPQKGKKITCKVTVTSNPKLAKQAVTVKKGKTVSVKLKGKAESVDNKYFNTAKAKIISKKSADTIKIKGLKKGKTTLKLSVNGVKLSITVKVI